VLIFFFNWPLSWCDDILEDPSNFRNQHPRMLQNCSPFKPMPDRHLKKTIRKVKRRRVGGAHPAAMVRPLNFFPFSLFNLAFSDLPLPDSRLPNGSSTHGPTGRPNSWSTTHWSGFTGSTIPGVGKPPLGRDPKSRAKSRDYLKQCVGSTLQSMYILSHEFPCHGIKDVYKKFPT
jgi:hypothetical protein